MTRKQEPTTVRSKPLARRQDRPLHDHGARARKFASAHVSGFGRISIIVSLVIGGLTAFSGAASAQAPYKIFRTGGQGVFLRVDGPSFSSNKAPGPNDGQTDFTVICQTTGENYSGSTIWDYIEYRGNRGYINDYFMYTGYDGFDPRLPRCPVATPTPPKPSDPFPVQGVFAAARDRNGPANVGRPTNAVHRWGAGDVQDFNGGKWGWNIIMQSDADKSKAFVVRTGFWEWYRANNNQGLGQLGYPTSEEYAHGNGSRQNFHKAMLEWKPGSRVVLVRYPAPKPPAPTPPKVTYLEPIAEYAGRVHSAAQAIANARMKIGDTKWEVGGDWCGSPGCEFSGCLNFTFQMYTQGTGVGGKGYWSPHEMINGSDRRPAVAGIVRKGVPPAGAIVLYSSPSGAGHAAISIGGGKVISQGVKGKIGEASYTAFKGYYGYIPFSG